MTKLLYLFLDGNKFVGEVPGTFARTLQIVDISNNLLSGMLPRGIGNSSISLEVIDLSRNYFEGTIPIEYFNSYGLEFLDLSENNLSGSLPLGFDAPSLRYVHLYRNQLSGPLPYAFYNLSSLVTLDLGDNNLTGPIPDWIDSVSELSIFVLKSNQFNGELPHQLCLLRRLSILDLSENNFSGHLPSCLSNLNFTASDEKSGYSYHTISSVYKRDNPEVEVEINVKIPVELTNKKNIYTYMGDILRYMSAVDLSCNRFTGEIPTEWGNLSGIHSLNLSQNNLTGLIPSSFSNLKQIESLDLSHNNLNGRIPAQLIELTFLAVFNVSYNNLSGRTPEMKNQFGTFDGSCYKGNPLLCGPLLPNSCDKTESPSERVPDNSNGDDGSIDMDSFYVSFEYYMQQITTNKGVQNKGLQLRNFTPSLTAMARAPGKHGLDQALDWELLKGTDKKMKKKSQASDLIGDDGRSKGKTSAADSSRSGSGQYDYSRNFGAINHLSSSLTTDEVSVDATSEKELAEDDCTEALNLDDHYIKAYSRRATARKELGKLKESIEDSGFALKLEPNNQEIKKQHSEVKSLYEKASGYLMLENDGDYLVKKSVYVKELRNKGTGAGSKSDGQVGNDSPANATPSSNVENVQKNNRTRRQELKTSVIELASQAASRAMAEAAKNITPPNSAYQFEVSWRGFSGDRALQTHLLKATSPSALPQGEGD
uniref:Uncharacterized protein n=1 Tax=Salix viminalis TaxID=40686 RepID=A0A6N2L912_SALVM